MWVQNVIDIEASPAEVWSHLIHFLVWPQWYRHCSDVTLLTGGSALSQHARFQFKTLDLFFEPEMVRFEPNRQLIWTAKGPAGTGGSHAWYIEPKGKGCRVVTEEAQFGLLLYLVRARTKRRLLAAHQDWLEGLERRVESAIASS